MGYVAVQQMVSSESVETNLKSLHAFFSEARESGAELVLLPENFACMGLRETDKLAIAEVFGEGRIQATVSRLAKQYGLWVIAGTVPIQGSKDRVRASCLVYDNAGACAARYDKIHLFDARISEQERYQESATIEPGNELVVVDTPIGCVGLTVCYDLRFPELYRALALKGAEVFTVPSAFTAVTGSAHWEALLRARAIENLCYVVAANQGGAHANGRVTYGHSMVVDPWGKIVGEQQAKVGMVLAEINLPYLHQLRKQLPCLKHRVLR